MQSYLRGCFRRLLRVLGMFEQLVHYGVTSGIQGAAILAEVQVIRNGVSRDTLDCGTRNASVLNSMCHLEKA